MHICREIGDVEIYALYPERFCSENLAIRKVFAFSDSVSYFGNAKITARARQGGRGYGKC